jgi:carboxyl-terminal processing protease
MIHTSAKATSLVFTLFATGVLGGAWAGAAAMDRAQDPYGPLDTLVRVMSVIETAYVDEISTSELVSAAIDGMIARLDRHSDWLTAPEVAELQADTRGEATGIGVEFSSGADGAVVTRVLPGSPAAREGIAPGDRIMEVDGAKVGQEVQAVEAALLGVRGDVARIKVMRTGWTEPATVEATRDVVHVPSVEIGRIDGVLYARVIQFQKGTGFELKTGLARELAPSDAVILDLRDNPGGLLDEAVQIADLFLDEGTIVSTWGRLESERTTHPATPGGLPADVPVWVLTNGWTASAAEIVAGALQDTRRATVVGTRTYGKGSVQTVFQHRDGSALKLTIGKYYTPSGTPVADREGRRPDVEVPWPVSSSPRSKLEARLAALDSPAEREELLALLAKIPDDTPTRRPPIPWDEPIVDRPGHDPQLAAALALAARADRKPAAP